MEGTYSTVRCIIAKCNWKTVKRTAEKRTEYYSTEEENRLGWIQRDKEKRVIWLDNDSIRYSALFCLLLITSLSHTPSLILCPYLSLSLCISLFLTFFSVTFSSSHSHFLNLSLNLFLLLSVDNLSGPTSPSGIKPEDLTDDVFSYIFLAKPLPAGVSTPISMELLQSMREVRACI